MFGNISSGESNTGFHTNINFGELTSPICPGNDADSNMFEMYIDCKNSGA
jgi:hypothetical protein